MSDNNKFKILLVDDDLVSINMGLLLLKKMGYKADYAESAVQALKKIESDNYDLILLDIMMPEISGIELAKKLKSCQKTKELPIIFLTGRSDPQSVLDAFEAGGSEYISKPFNNLEFIVRVKNQITIAEYKKSLIDNNLYLDKLLKETMGQLLKTERQAAYGEVIQGIVHNLRSPLHVAKGRIELIAVKNDTIISKGGFEALTKEELLKHIEFLNKSHNSVDKAIERINEMINSLLVKSSSDNNQESEVFDLNMMINNELSFYNANLHYKHEINKTIEIYPEILSVKASTSVLSQVFGNILKNSLDELYDKKDAEITIKTGKKDDYVYFSIKDNGRGIPEDVQQKIFDPFFTTKPRMKNENDNSPVGTGLGLHFCYKAITDLNGKIELISKTGEGTEFLVYLPEYSE